MCYIQRDFITWSELTADNIVRCLNGYLSSVKLVDKDVTEILLLYIDTALELGGADLADAVIDCIRVDLIQRYC